MPYYEFFIYGPSRKRLTEVQETLVNLWEFDPNSASIRRSWRPWDYALAKRLFNLFGIHHKDDWLMTITGPEIYREQAYTVSAAWEGYCDGGGYDFGYDPYLHYSDAQVRRHTEAWEAKTREAEARLMDMLPEDEQARIRVAMEDLLGHIRAHEDDEG